MSHIPRLKDHSNIDNTISATIKKLINEKDKTCVSIIVPTHSLGQDRQGDRKAIQEAVAEAKQAVLYEREDYLSTIDYLLQQIDFNTAKEGIGIFVSPNIRILIKFPFPVKKKIVVNKFFHLQDLLYIENYCMPYYLLDISKKEIHLFRGIMDQFEEIQNKNFPRKIHEEYEYTKPSRSSSHAGYAHVKGFEKDKSEVEHIRLKKVFREADRCLSEYLTGKTPLLLCGPERDISLYKFVTKHEHNIITSISDNYRGADFHDLELLSWLQIKSYVDNQKLVLIDEFKEKIGAGLAVYGVENVWKAAKAGKGFKLLVEKDYGNTAFVRGRKHRKCGDIVDEIVITTLEKNGKVIIIENDALQDYNRIALIKRYH